MKNYFRLEIKRILRLLPFVLLSLLVLLLCLGIIFGNIAASAIDNEESQVATFAVCGDLEGTYLDMGITALQNIDSSRYILTLEFMEEEAARELLSRNEISAVLIIPDSFAKEAYYGNILPITYLCNNDSVELSGFFKEALTDVISTALSSGLKATYGTAGALYDNRLGSQAGKITDNVALEYTDLILSRSNTYTVTEFGISDNMDLPGYFFCGIGTLLLLLMALPFSVIYVRRDYSFHQIMASKGYGCTKQVFTEFSALSVGLVTLYSFVALCLFLAGEYTYLPLSTIIITNNPLEAFIWTLPLIIMISAFSLLIFELSKSIVSAVLLHFFMSVVLCYITGCLYPIFMFPEVIQKVAAFLPTGIARTHLAGCITDSDVLLTALMLLAYTLMFLILAMVIRRLKFTRKG